MYRIGSSIKKSNQIRVAATQSVTTNVTVRNYTTNGENGVSGEKVVEVKKKFNSSKRSGGSRERFSEFVDDDEVVIDYRKVVEKKKTVGEQTQDFDKMLAGLTMKELKLMRYRDNPETYELFRRQHVNLNDAFNMNITTKSLLEKQKLKKESELPGSQFKTQKVTYDKLSQVKSEYIAQELNKFKDQFEKPLVEAYNEVTNQQNLLYRTKRAEERLMKKRIEKSKKQYQLNSLERHYRDIVQVRNALDFRGKSILANQDEEDAWQRILERSEITDPHNLSRLHMMDEYNDLGYQSELNEDYINQLSIVPFDYANPASYASLVNLLDQLITVDSYRDNDEISQLLINEKLRKLQDEKDPSKKDEIENQIIDDIEADNYLESGKLQSSSSPTIPQFSEEDFAKLSKEELEELKLVKMAAKRLQEYQDARDRIAELEDPTNQKLIDSLEFYQSMNKPSVENSKSTAQLMYVADISLKAGSRPLTEEEIVDLLPYDEEVVEDPEDLIEAPVEEQQLDADGNPIPKPEEPFEDLPGSVNKDFFDSEGNFILEDTTEKVEVETASVENGEVVVTTEIVEKQIIPTFDHLKNVDKKADNIEVEETPEDEAISSFFNQVSEEEIDSMIESDIQEREREIEYINEQRTLEHEDRDAPEEDPKPLPSKLPDFDALSAKIRKREEDSLNAIAERFIDQEINEKSATEVLDQIYESYKENNLFSPDIIEHDRNTIREANGDVAIPDSMYFEYDTTFGDLVDRDVVFKMPLKDTDLVRVLTHQLTETGLLKQEKVLKYTPDDMPVSKEMVESMPDVFPNFVKEIVEQDPNESTDCVIKVAEYRNSEETEGESNIEETEGESKSEENNVSSSSEITSDISNGRSSSGSGKLVDEIVIKRKEGGNEEIYDERRLYINLSPAVKDEGVISVPTVFKKKTTPIQKDEVDSNNGWLMGKPFDMLDYRLQGQPNKLPIDEEQVDNEEEEDIDEPAPLIEELVDEEDEDFRDLTPGIDQEPELFEETDLYHYLQQGGNQEWFRPEKINDSDIALLERRQTWFPNQRQHIATYPFEFVSSHGTTDQTTHDSWVNRKAVLKVNINAFELSPAVEERLAQLTANRYDSKKKVLTLVASNHKTLPENKYETKRIFRELLHEANLADPNFVSVRPDNYKAASPPSFVPSVHAKAQEKFNIYRLQGFPILNTQQKQHLELYSYIKSQLE